MSPAGDSPGPADLAEWVRYLKDIGVRELNVAAATPVAHEAAAPSAAPTAKSVEDRAVAQATLPALQIGDVSSVKPGSTV